MVVGAHAGDDFVDDANASSPRGLSLVTITLSARRDATAPSVGACRGRARRRSRTRKSTCFCHHDFAQSAEHLFQRIRVWA